MPKANLPETKGEPGYKAVYGHSARAAKRYMLRNLPKELVPHKQIIEKALNAAIQYDSNGELRVDGPEDRLLSELRKIGNRKLEKQALDHIANSAIAMSKVARAELTNPAGITNPLGNISLTAQNAKTAH